MRISGEPFPSGGFLILQIATVLLLARELGADPIPDSVFLDLQPR
jgi:hypothetical protein